MFKKKALKSEIMIHKMGLQDQGEKMNKQLNGWCF